jgi:1-acyl-sn-glycerol-3-phosphate acyltransferase
MRALRTSSSSFVVTTYYCMLVILASLIGVKLRPDGVYDRAAREWGRKLIRLNGLGVSIRGMDNIPDRSCVFVANHVSWVDVWVLAALLPGRVRFLAKRELFWVPFFGSAMKQAGHIPIDRQNRRAAFDAYAEAVRLIQQGTRAVIFGEGTRSRTGRSSHSRKGPSSGDSGRRPRGSVFIEGTYGVLPKGSIMLRPRPITVLVGEPLLTQGLSYEDRSRWGSVAGRAWSPCGTTLTGLWCPSKLRRPTRRTKD